MKIACWLKEYFPSLILEGEVVECADTCVEEFPFLRLRQISVEFTSQELYIYSNAPWDFVIIGKGLLK